MAPDYEPGRGQLLVWYGAPGTGKSYALSALAFAWREWASFAYIADPEAFLSETAYLLEWMTLRHPEDRWRVAILEDTGELFGTDAGMRTGQGLGRLLNATDGMLGKGSKTLFVITTNEPISRFHEAVVRPGRCVSRVEFEMMPVEQAKAWLISRGVAEMAKHVTGPTTVAELFAMAAGDFKPPVPSATGMYL
jgi:ATP-dependent 26S proteasome regulatory subunit